MTSILQRKHLTTQLMFKIQYDTYKNPNYVRVLIFIILGKFSKLSYITKNRSAKDRTAAEM